MRKIKIKIDYYDDKEEAAIKVNFPEDFKKISKIAGTIIEVAFEDFKTYGFFRNQFTENGRPATFLELEPHAKEWGHFNVYLSLKDTGELVNKFPNDTIEVKEVSEMIGVAGALSAASHIYGLTQADWVKIPVKPHKDFDFSHCAALNNRIVQIEAKGSVIDDNSTKRSAVSQHKASIKKKKSDAAFIAKNKGLKASFIGYITVADRSNILQTWLVDPPPEALMIDPYRYKLLKRLTYYFQIVRAITPRSHLVLVLANRLASLGTIENYRDLNRVPLTNSDQEALVISNQMKSQHTIGENFQDFFGTFSVQGNTPIVLFLPTDLLDILIKQDFDSIVKYTFQPRTVVARMSVQVSQKVFHQVGRLSVGEINQRMDHRQRLFVDAEIEATISSSGLGYWVGLQTANI